MVWGKAGSTTASATTDEVSSGTITANKFLNNIYHVIKTGTANTRRRFNNDTGSNYASRSHVLGTEGTQINQTSIFTHADTSGNGFGVSYIVNISGEEKLMIGQEVSNGSNGAGTAPVRYEGVGKWVNTSAQITEVDLLNTDSGGFLTGSNLTVLGNEITPTAGKPTNVQVGSRWEETDTRKMYHYNSNTYASSAPNLATSTITVGEGGAYNGDATGRIGDDSTAFGLTAKGGGAGLNHTIGSSYKDGGSGGGQTSEGGTIGATTQTSQSGDSGTYGYGNLGGQATSFSNTYISTGGGGGSFSRGIVGGTSSVSTNGGDGLGGTNNTAINQFLIDSSAGVQDGSTGYYYIAGGGGGGNQRNAGTAGVAGKGGGGNGTIDNGTNAGDGVANSGSGGGGGGNNNCHEGNGGEGVCIIKYKTSEITATGGNNTYVVGDYTYRKFTSSGTLTVSSGTGKYDVLLIAGGGAGYDSAGGAGGLVYRNGLQILSWSEEGT